jgi:transcriptional regulator with XRE-family HTH domain
MHNIVTAAAIRAEMARRGVRQRDLAAALGISQQAMSNRLCGITPLTAAEIQAIADALGCQPETFGAQHV